MIVTPPLTGRVDRVLSAPPSKSYTHRALIAGALGSGTTTIFNPLYAEDTRLTVNALRTLGVSISITPEEIIITGSGGRFPNPKETLLDLDNSGTSLRLLTSLALLCRHPVILTGSQRMQERPIAPLARAILALGGSVTFLKNEGYPPLKVGGRLEGGRVTVDGTISSQFISSLLLVAPCAEREVELTIPCPPSSRSYIDITLDVMRAFGADVIRDGYTRFTVSNRAPYSGVNYAVEGDYSSASYFFAIAAICGGRVTVKNLKPDSVQGDRRFPDALGAMGCTVTCGRGPGDGRENRRSPRDHDRYVNLSRHRPDTLYGRRDGNNAHHNHRDSPFKVQGERSHQRYCRTPPVTGGGCRR